MAPKTKSSQQELFDRTLRDPSRTPLTDEEKEDLRNNWVAPSKSAQEKRMLRQWATQGELSDKERALVRAWLDKPDGFEKRNEAFWRAAKKLILGKVVYDVALARHKQLRPDEWLVACLIVQGIKQDEIAEMIDKSERTVDGIVRAIKDKVVRDLECDLASVRLPQITRWFFGL